MDVGSTQSATHLLTRTENMTGTMYSIPPVISNMITARDTVAQHGKGNTKDTRRRKSELCRNNKTGKRGRGRNNNENMMW